MKSNVIFALLALCIISVTALCLLTEEKPEEVVSVNVKWGHVDIPKGEDRTKHYTLDYAEHPVMITEEPEPSVDFITTNDVGLVNYAAKLESDGWSLVGVDYNDYSVPEITYQFNAKTYMKFQTLGYDSWNRQGHLARQRDAYTGNYLIRMIDGRALIAVGSYYCKVTGTYIDVLLEDGTVIPCIMGDAKSDAHTDPTHSYQKYDKSVVEFIIDSPGTNEKDYSYFAERYPYVNGNFSNIPEYSSPVVGLRVYNKVYNINMNDMTNDNPDGGATNGDDIQETEDASEG